MTNNCFLAIHEMICLLLDVQYTLAPTPTSSLKGKASITIEEINTAKANNRAAKIISSKGYSESEYNIQHALMQARRRSHWR